MLERNARRHLMKQRNQKSKNKQKVVYAGGESAEEVKLVVVESSFTDVIQAMYTNEKLAQSRAANTAATQTEQATKEDYTQVPTESGAAIKNSTQMLSSKGENQQINSTLLDETNVRSTVENEETNQDIVTNLGLLAKNTNMSTD